MGSHEFLSIEDFGDQELAQLVRSLAHARSAVYQLKLVAGGEYRRNMCGRYLGDLELEARTVLDSRRSSDQPAV